MPTEKYSQEEYIQEFSDAKKEHAFKLALDIRKFEIDLYWRRATYFWTFIAATLAGFAAIQASSAANKADLSVLLSCLGVVFSFGWFSVNRGSKHWQENWENHLDMLEDEFAGPLYKVILTRSKPKGLIEWASHLITGPSAISVSKINDTGSAGACDSPKPAETSTKTQHNSRYLSVIDMGVPLVCVLTVGD